jgi:hypothetical protein
MVLLKCYRFYKIRQLRNSNVFIWYNVAAYLLLHAISDYVIRSNNNISVFLKINPHLSDHIKAIYVSIFAHC